MNISLQLKSSSLLNKVFTTTSVFPTKHVVNSKGLQ